MLWFLSEEKDDDDEGGSILMEDEIWRELPEDILFAALERLPLISFLRFRSVCKRWNALLRYPSSFFSSPPACCNKQFAIFSTLLLHAAEPEQEIHEIHQFLQRQQRRIDHIRLNWHPFELDFLHPCDSVVSSHSGIVLISRKNGRYLVCNPLLRVWTELPQAPIASDLFSLKGIFRINPSSTSFKVIWRGWADSPVTGAGKLLRCFLYDSSIRELKNIAGCPFSNSPVSGYNGVVCKNICYWSTITFDLLGFDFERETWIIIEAIQVPDFMPESIPEISACLLCLHWKEDHLMMIVQDERRVSIWLSSMSISIGNPLVWDEIETLTEDAIPNEFLVSHCACIGNTVLLYDFIEGKLIAYNIASKVSMLSYIAIDSSLLCLSFVSFYPSWQTIDSHSS